MNACHLKFAAALRFVSRISKLEQTERLKGADLSTFPRSKNGQVRLVSDSDEGKLVLAPDDERERQQDRCITKNARAWGPKHI
jgi:hypothetical protein